MRWIVTLAVVWAATSPARAQSITFGGYVETYYSFNFRRPSNHITNLRGFDNREGTFTLSNVALGTKATRGPLSVEIILQVGSTPSTYYLAEPTLAGTSTVNANDGPLWKYIQKAVFAYNAPHGFVLDAGLMPSPIGCEAFAVKDNWNWSRSNLFFGLPFYHTGARVAHALSDSWTGMLHVYSGWNSVVDNNPYPSIALSANYASDAVKGQVIYMGGIERPPGAPEGNAWRNLLDAVATIDISDAVAVQGELDGGVEPNAFGTSGWFAAAAYGKVTLSDALFTALRVDYFREWVATGATPIVWPTEWLASITATLAYQPIDGVSLRLELRHDQAKTPVFFGGTVEGDGVTMPFVPNRRSQDTMTLGATAWF